MDDLQAILRLKSGDINGLDFLISKYQVKAVRTAYLVTHNRPMAEDVVQDAFVHFYERVHQFDECRLFEPYFMVSVMNAALNAALREKRILPLPQDADEADLETLLSRSLICGKRGGTISIEGRDTGFAGQAFSAAESGGSSKILSRHVRKGNERSVANCTRNNQMVVECRPNQVAWPA